jgi:predicted nucleic acid-binding Zn ribbon protein
MIRPAEISIKDAIEKLLSNYKLKGKVVEAQLQEKWPEIVGAMISRHTREVQLRNQKLFIRIDSAVVKQELFYVRTKIKEKVNQELGGEYVQEVILL